MLWPPVWAAPGRARVGASRWRRTSAQVWRQGAGPHQSKSMSLSGVRSTSPSGVRSRSGSSLPPLLLGGVLVVVFEALLVVGVHEVAAVDAGDAVVAVLEVGVVAVVVGGLGDVVLWGGRCGHGGGGEGHAGAEQRHGCAASTIRRFQEMLFIGVLRGILQGGLFFGPVSSGAFPRWGLLPMSPSARLPSCHRNTWLDTRRRPWFDWPGRMCGPGRAGVRPRRAHRTMTVSAYPAAKETARPSGHHRRRRPAHPEHRLLLPGHQQPPRRCHRSLHHPTRRPDHYPPGPLDS